MVHKFAEADAEGTNSGRHQDVTTTGSLRASFKHTPMHRPHLVGMIREVCARAGIVEREHATDEERTLMVRCGERTAESSTCLAVAHEAICKEETVFGSETISYLAGLAHETVLEFAGIGDA